MTARDVAIWQHRWTAVPDVSIVTTNRGCEAIAPWRLNSKAGAGTSTIELTQTADAWSCVYKSAHLGSCGLKTQQPKAQGFSPVIEQKAECATCKVASGYQIGRDFAELLATFQVDAPCSLRRHRAEALCFGLVGLQPTKDLGKLG